MNYCALKRMGFKTFIAMGWFTAAVFILTGLGIIFKEYAGWCCTNHYGVDYSQASMWLIIVVGGLFLAWVTVMSLMDWYDREVIKCSSEQLHPNRPDRRSKK